MILGGRNMSRFNAILLAILSFGSSSLLMGMEKEQKLAPFKYSNPYFNQELRKSLFLIMQKNAYFDSLNLDKDVIKVIAKKSYDLYRDSLLDGDQLSKIHLLYVKERPGLFLERLLHRGNESFKFQQFHGLNNITRTNQFHGKSIRVDDFDLMTMNDEGRQAFVCLTGAIPFDFDCNGTFRHKHEANYTNETQLKADNGLLSQDAYNKVLDLPIELRRKVGELCTMKVIGPKVRHYYFFNEGALAVQAICAVPGIVVGGQWGVMKMICEGSSFFKSVGYFTGVGAACGLGVGAVVTVYITRELESEAVQKYGSKIELIEKPLIAPEEQEFFKAEKEMQEAVTREKVKRETREKKAQEKKLIEGYWNDALVQEVEEREQIRFKQLPIELPNKLRSDFASLRNLE